MTDAQIHAMRCKEEKTDLHTKNESMRLGQKCIISLPSPRWEPDETRKRTRWKLLKMLSALVVSLEQERQITSPVWLCHHYSSQNYWKALQQYISSVKFSVNDPFSSLFFSPMLVKKDSRRLSNERMEWMLDQIAQMCDSYTPCNANLVTPLNSEIVQGSLFGCACAMREDVVYSRGLQSSHNRGFIRRNVCRF